MQTTLKLYYAPGACSLAPLIELGMARVSARPTVQAAMKAEGLLA